MWTIVVLLMSLQIATSAPSFATSSSNPSGISMLELSTRPWLYSLSLKYNKPNMTIDQVPDQEWLDLITQGKFDYIWLMGLWQLGEYGLNYDKTNQDLLNHYSQVLPGFTQDDIIGSPYAVTTYTLNPQIAPSEGALITVRKKLRSWGVGLMVDFVPNHSAVDSPLTSSNIDYYIRAPKGSQPDPVNYLPNGIAFGSACGGCGSWPDTAQFNIFNPQLRQVRAMNLMKAASLSDAIRCDMAYLFLNDVFESTWSNQLNSWGWNMPQTEFWSDAITAVKAKYPGTIFLAEVYAGYDYALQQHGFDYTYDKTLYDKLTNGNLDDLRNWIANGGNMSAARGAHFTSNHDEVRAVTNFGSWWRADCAALLTFTLPGMRFYWMWDYLGYSSQVDIHLRREVTETVNKDVQLFYQQLWNITSQDVFRSGQWSYLTVQNSNDSWRLIAYKWTLGDKKVLCVINYSDSNGSGAIILNDAQPRNGNDTIPVTDLLSGQTWYRSAEQMRTQGLFVVINSWYGQILTY